MDPEDVHVLLSEDKIEEYREVFSFFDRVCESFGSFFYC